MATPRPLPLFGDGAFDGACVSFALHEMPRTIRERALREMARVTKPNGTVVVVDYALPRKPWLRTLAFHAIQLYERDHYADFVRSDLRASLNAAGIDVVDDRPALLGMARIVVGRTAPDRSRTAEHACS